MAQDRVGFREGRGLFPSAEAAQRPGECVAFRATRMEGASAPAGGPVSGRARCAALRATRMEGASAPAGGPVSGRARRRFAQLRMEGASAPVHDELSLSCSLVRASDATKSRQWGHGSPGGGSGSRAGARGERLLAGRRPPASPRSVPRPCGQDSDRVLVYGSVFSAPHRARVRRRRGGVDRLEAGYRPRDWQPRPRLRGRSLWNRPRGGSPDSSRWASRSGPPTRATRMATAKRRPQRLPSATILILVSLAIGAIAAVRLVEGGHEVDATWWALLVVVIVIVVDAGRASVSFRAGRRSSPALVTSAFHFLSDLGGSVAVLIGLLAARGGYPEADAAAALFVAVLVLAGAGRLVRQNVDVLMDRAGGVRGDRPARHRRAGAGRRAAAAPDAGCRPALRRRGRRRPARSGGRAGACGRRRGRGRRRRGAAGHGRGRPRRTGGCVRRSAPRTRACVGARGRARARSTTSACSGSASTSRSRST